MKSNLKKQNIATDKIGKSKQNIALAKLNFLNMKADRKTNSIIKAIIAPLAFVK